MPPATTKIPQAVFDTIFVFPPNRETLGGSAYLVLEKNAHGQSANILIDCPAFNQVNQAFIAANGGIHTLFITHRGGMAQVADFQKAFDAQVVIQEQEAYLLPAVTTNSFARDRILSPTSRVFWNAGHSPGSACLYHQPYGGVLFTGRHLLPNQQGAPTPLRLSKTFHWPRQLRHAQKLLSDFTPDTLSTICPGASMGFLRGEKKITRAYQQLQGLDWDQLKTAQPAL
ncbi:MAG: MBL fold metallo-hydrolase [Phormidesmis sp. RL_2_1]|nr:MBL fold metallo-hydrolase [Phormidesmis sp. RL_2_1]